MKNILAIVALVGLTALANGCGGTLTCDDIKKLGTENDEAVVKFRTAIGIGKKDEATAQRDLFAKNCKALEGVATMKCKFDAKGEEVEVKGEAFKKSCEDNLKIMDEKLK